jgi:hypothetical protein
MLPRSMTEALELPEKLCRPAMKSALEMSSVEATMPPSWFQLL